MSDGGPVPASGTRLRRLATGDLSPDEIAALRQFLVDAFGPPDAPEGFSDDDWAHATGGLHFVLDRDGAIVAHAAVVEREIHVGERHLRTGYVEAVATAPWAQGQGHGSVVMRAVSEWIRERFELGALGTGAQHFYERLGWRVWAGPTCVRTAGGCVPTPDDDGFVMVLLTPATPPLDPAAPISCEWRPGDAW